MQQDDTHPYYFGACTLTCTAPAMTQDTELELSLIHIYNINVLRQRSRDAYMGIPTAAAALKTMGTNVIAGGLMPAPQIDGLCASAATIVACHCGKVIAANDSTYRCV